jgi:hypothetical protein
MTVPRIKPRQLEPSTTNGDQLVTSGGQVVWGAGSLARLVPLTTAIGSSPDLVWDGNDELVLTEVTL